MTPCIVLLSAALLAAGVTAVLGEVEIVEDEIVFSIAAPGASDVYLVGDFNNWNPTYEFMDETDGRFEVRLFLLPGTYRYKFVVDGEWITDPDNPPADSASGSLIIIVERAGALAFADGQPAGEEPRGPVFRPALRYAGAFFLDHGDTRSTQALDVWFSHASDKVNASVGLKTVGESWTVSPVGAEILFDRGHVDLKLDDGVFRAFENDSIWSSLDPFHLIGDVGVYGYNAGFERRGVSARFPFVLNTKLRGFYADKTDERPGPPLAIEREAFGDFEGSAGTDTLVYRYAETFEDEDAWGVEFAGDVGSFDFGYVRRSNKGYQPGSLAQVTRFPSSFGTVFYTTREFWEADAGWLKWNFLPRLHAVGGFGRATGEIRTAARSASTVDVIDRLEIGQSPETFERSFPTQSDKRWTAGLELEAEGATGRALFTRSEYDFEGVYSFATAVVNDFSVDAAYRWGSWRAAGLVRYLDQDYGASPDEFHYFTPRKNAWIDYRDQLTIDRMVSFDLEKSTEIEAHLLWGERSLSTLSGTDGGAASAAVVSAGLVSRGVLEAIEYAFVRAGVEYAIDERFFVQGDSRLAVYHKPSWGLEDTFFSAYGEFGFRNRWSEISLGVGLDPVVLDPVTNLYADIGREEFLREGIPAGLTRSRAEALGEGLKDRETSLEDYGAVKLEIILVF